MPSENLWLGVEIVLLCLFFLALLFSVPIVALVFTLVAESAVSLQGIPPSPRDRFGLDIYFVSGASFAIPIVILAGTGWALRRWITRLDE